MAATTRWYSLGGRHIVTDVNWINDSIKVSLHSGTYTPAQATHEFFSNVTGELSTGNGYTSGGATLSNKTISTSGLVTVFDANDVTWTAGAGQTLTARYAVIRKDTGVASTSPLLGYVDFGGESSTTGGNFTITWDSTQGVLKLTVV